MPCAPNSSDSMNGTLSIVDPSLGVESACDRADGCSRTVGSPQSDQMTKVAGASGHDVDREAASHPDCKGTGTAHGIDDGPLEHAGHAQHMFSADETLLIFDWDDTILPSTWVAAQRLTLDKGSVLTDKQREQLKEVSLCTTETLSLAKQVGTVVLITNAERGWIELSSCKFLPEIVPLLENCKLISARTAHESPERPLPLDWKLEAFAREMVSRTQNDRKSTKDAAAFTNVLSIGDGAYERESLIRVSASLPECRGKSLRFVERPSIGKLCRQHRLVSKRLRQLVRYDGDLDLSMRSGKKKRKAKTAFPDQLDTSQPGTRLRLEGVQGFDAMPQPSVDQLGASQPDSPLGLGVVQGFDAVVERTCDDLDANHVGFPLGVQGFDAVLVPIPEQLDASQMGLLPGFDCA